MTEPPRELPKILPRKITDDPYGAAVLIRRLVVEQGLAFWPRYLQAFALMGVVAAATAGATYVLGQVINQAYVDKNVRGIALFSGVTVILLFIKGVATYGQTVILSKISNAILANNQRRLFAKLMNESIGFFSERHSSEFLARLTSGAKSITDLLNMLINAIGRDFLILVAMICVMVTQDPILSLIGLLVVPPAMLILRKLVKRELPLSPATYDKVTAVLPTFPTGDGWTIHGKTGTGSVATPIGLPEYQSLADESTQRAIVDARDRQYVE